MSMWSRWDTRQGNQAKYASSWALGAAYVVLAVTLVACGPVERQHTAEAVPPMSSTTSKTASSMPLVTSLTSPPTTPALDAVRPAVLAAYRGMWADEVAAAATADYQSPLLAQHAAGAALSLLVRGLYAYHQEGLVAKGQPVTHPQVTSLSPTSAPTQATVLDCFDDTHWLVYKSSGGLENNVPGGHRKVTAVVQDMNGVWKVTQLDTGAEGTC